MDRSVSRNKNKRVPWQLTVMGCVCLQLEQVFCACGCVCVHEDNFDTHRCLDNLSTVHSHLPSGLFVHIRASL